MKRIALAAVAAAALITLSAPVSAATLTEADYGGFSHNSGWVWGSSASSSSEIGYGYTSVSGTGVSNQHDFLRFTGLPTGAQTVSISFGYVPDATSNNRDVSVYWSPFVVCNWCGTGLGKFSMNAQNPTRDYTLTLGDDFAGDLFLQLNFLSGTGIYYNITGSGFAAMSDPTPPSGSAPAVPLPAGVWLGLSALAALGLLRRRRA